MVDSPRGPRLPGLTARHIQGHIAWQSKLCHDARAVPTYDYQCRSCGSVTEVIHSMLEDGPSVCERCGGELRRVLFPAGIIFKGSGFYRTDSRNGASAATSGVSSSGKDADRGSAPTGSSTKETSASSDAGTSSDGGKSKASEASTS